MKKQKANILKVSLNGIKVGELVKGSANEISFSYDESWLEIGFAISRSLPLQEASYKGEIVSRYFDNLLPDNDKIKELVADKFAAESTDSFDLLGVIGLDCVGALSFIPEGQQLDTNLDLHYTKITESEIARRLRNLGKATPLGMGKDDAFRISIAGAQEKTAFLSLNNNWFEPHGLTPTTHIFKNKIGALGEVGEEKNFSDSIDNEWSVFYIMKKMGFNVCEAKIEIFEDQKVLVVKRFDRKWVKKNDEEFLLRLPQEDMCQALSYSPHKKYQSKGGPGIKEICDFLRGSKNIKDRETLFKAIIVFDLFYATDGHAKNFSIFLEEDGFRLTPFYDVMSGYFLHAREKVPLEELVLAMKVGHYQFKRIFKKHYKKLASECGFSKQKYQQMMQEVFESYANLEINKDELDPKLEHATLDLILEGMQKRAKVLFE